MHTTLVDIYSDQSNAAIMRHPERRYPGVLIQGDMLYSLCIRADEVCDSAKQSLNTDTYSELNVLRNALRDLLTHYKVVLGEHQMPLPFSE